MKISFLILSIVVLFSVVSTFKVPLIAIYKNQQYELESLNNNIQGVLKASNMTGHYRAVWAKDTYLRWWTETVNATNIRLTGVSLDKKFTNMKSTNQTDIPFIYSGNGIFKFDFAFDYDYSCIRSGKGSGVFSLTSKSTNLSVFRDNFSTAAYVDFDEFSSNVHINTGPYANDNEVARLVASALVSFNNEADRLADELSRELTVDFDKFEKDAHIQFNTNAPYKTVDIMASSISNPVPIGDGILYKLDGNVKNTNYNETSPKEWNNFNPNDGGYQLFVHQQVLNEVYYDLTQNGGFGFAVNSTNLPSGLSFHLNIQTLSKILPDILSSYPADDAIRLHVYLDSFKFTTDTSSITAQIMVNVHFFHERSGNLLLISESVSSVNIIKSYVNKLLNFNFDAKTFTVDYSFADASFGKFVDIYLNQYLKEGFTAYLSKNTYSLFPSSIKVNTENFEIRFIENYGVLLVIKNKSPVKVRSLKFLTE